MNPERLLDRRHRAKGTERVVSLLKSPSYGPSGAAAPLPYRIDLLADRNYEIRWTDEGPGQTLRTAVSRLERLTVPFWQAWRTRGERAGASVTLAMFESEAHGLALWRRLTGRRHPPLVVIACWLTEIASSSPLRQRLYRRLYESVDHVVVFSENQRTVLVETLDIPVDRVTAVRFGVDLDELAEIDTSDDGASVVAVGRDLGRDWRTLATAVDGTGWNVHLVTRPTQVDAIDLPAEIRHRPPVDRATYLDLLARAAVVVVPTDVRAYPSGQTVLLEAMALGKACVVTDTPAMADYVSDAVTVLTVPPHDADALRRAIRRLLDDPALRTALGMRAREVETERGGARAMWSQVADVLERSVQADD